MPQAADPARQSSGLSALFRRVAGLCRRLWASPLVRFLVAGLAVVAAAWTVRLELREVRLADVATAVRATPPWVVALAVAFTAGSHAGLAFAEWLALKATGRAQPLGPTLVRAFAANALSSVVGFGLASGTALRVRLYKDAGLDAKAVARLVLVTTVATYLSGVIVLGLSILAAGPRSAGPWLSTPLWPLAGLALLSPAALWFVMFRDRGGRTGPPLRRRDRGLALLASLCDWVFSGAALFVLTSRDPLGLPRFLLVFCLGSLLGSLAGAPGGIGVLDATVLGLHGGLKVHATAAALILYRLVYLLGPALVALLVLAVRRLVRSRQGSPNAP